MKATIGKYIVIHTQMLLVPEGEDAWVEFDALDWHVRLKFIITENPDNSKKQGYVMTGYESHGEIELKNWNSSGMSFKEPVAIGQTEEKNVFLMVFSYKIGDIVKLDLQFYMEDPA